MLPYSLPSRTVKESVLREIRKQPLSPAQWCFLAQLGEIVRRDEPISAFCAFLSAGITDGQEDRHGRTAAKVNALSALDGLALSDRQWLIVGRFAAIIQRDAAFNLVRGIFREGPSDEMP